MSDQFPVLPKEFQPGDDRFGCGLSKVRPARIQTIVDGSTPIIGTSHRQSAVKNVVGEVCGGPAKLFQLPEGYEIVLSPGGTTALWNAATFGLIKKKSAHLTYGEFPSRFAKASKVAPWLDAPQIIKAEPGSAPEVITGGEGVDLIGWAHNGTSTGTMVPITRPAGPEDQFVVIDTTSGIDGLSVDMSQADVYCFSPQKYFASDDDIWLTAMSPVTIERVEEINSSDRFIPVFLNPQTITDNSRRNQIYDALTIGTSLMLADQVKRMDTNSGLDDTVARTIESSSHLYNWAESHAGVTPFVTDAARRSLVVGIIDSEDNIDTVQITKVLRANGILDIEPYRKLGRNQLRIGMFPAIDPEDIRRLTGAINWVLDNGYAIK